MSAAHDDEVIAVEDLRVHFPIRRGWFVERVAGVVKAVDGVSFAIRRGETLGLVGESGCGKTTIGRAIVGLNAPTGGTIRFRGRDLASMSPEELRRARPRLQFVFQDPYASLNPRMTVGAIIAEPIRLHALRNDGAATRARVDELLSLVGLSTRFAERYPHELSGGQRQRVGIARALACEPELIVCDEPVSALDVSIQAQVINLLQDLQARLGLTYLFIAHGLGVIRHISTRVAVMYLGHIVEIGDKRALCENPRHPYTRALLSASPVPDPRIERKRRRIILTGDVPNPIAPPPGCRFSTRCPIAIARCREETPVLTHDRGAAVACWRAHEVETAMAAIQAA
jgi:oligopeptide transport system ATP-binding protein